MTLAEERRLYEDEIPKYEKLVELARRVHQPVAVPLWSLQVKRADGSVRVKRESFSHSWTRNLYNAHTHYSLFAQTDYDPVGTGHAEGQLGLRKVDGAIFTGTFSQDFFPEPHIFGGGYGAFTNELYGTVIGTGTTAESFEDFNVEGLIADGARAGQMQYKIASLVKGWNAGSRYFFSQWTRDFDNDSGGTIVVGNVVMVFQSQNSGRLCFIRDVLSPTQDVLDTETLTHVYEFRLYFP